MHVLTEQNDYSTPEKQPALAARLCPELYFYPRMIRVIVKASSLAKKGQYTTEKWTGSSTAISRALEKTGVRFHVRNRHVFRNLNGPCVVIGNHMSTLETFVIPTLIQSMLDITFIVKKSLIDYPVFRHVMRARDPIVVTRENPRQDLKTVLEQGLDRLQRGISVVVFPQTTRSLTFDPRLFNTIGVKLAQRAGVPVVPVALKTDAWENGKWVREFGKIVPQRPVHFHFGDPLPVEGSGRETHQQIIDFIQARLDSWNGRSP